MALLTFQKSTFISLKETIREVCLDFHCYSSLFGQGTQYFLFSPICLMAKVVKKKKKKRLDGSLEHFEICLRLSLVEKSLNRELYFLYRFHANVKRISVYSQILEGKNP